MNDMNELMKQAQEMQKRMQEAQQELTDLVVTGEAGGGMVKIDMNGRHDAIKVSVADNVINDKGLMEDLVAAAINDANRKIEKASRDKLTDLTSGLKLPEGFNMPPTGGDNA